MSARVPTSRAYWNLRAEQVIDNVFDRETVTAPSQPHLVPVEVDVVDVHEPTTKPTEPSERRSPSTWLLLLISGIAVAGIGEAIGSSGWVLSEVTDSGAVISRNGQRQTLSVGGLF